MMTIKVNTFETPCFILGYSSCFAIDIKLIQTNDYLYVIRKTYVWFHSIRLFP